MATSKVSQGLSFSTIVLAVISIFILVLVILFVSGGLKGTSQATDVYVPGELESARTACNAACNVVQSTARFPENFVNSDYCKRTFRFSTDAAGDPGHNCYEAAPSINVNCNGFQIQGISIDGKDSTANNDLLGCTESLATY